MRDRRLYLTLTDGLRPEAITPSSMPALHGPIAAVVSQSRVALRALHASDVVAGMTLGLAGALAAAALV